MLEAGLWALLGQLSLLVGAGIALVWAVPRRILGLVAGFGAGTLVAAAAFELCVPAYHQAGRAWIAGALAAGAITFYATDRAVARHSPPGEHGSVGIALGALLDGVPESIAIAISLISGATVSTAMLAAVLLSNLPEGMASSPGFRRAGWPSGRIMLMWSGIAVAGALAAMLGHAVLRDAADTALGVVNAFAAGTILTMIASVMLPTAFADGREPVGLVFVLGFAVLGGLSTLGV